MRSIIFHVQYRRKRASRHVGTRPLFFHSFLLLVLLQLCCHKSFCRCKAGVAVSCIGTVSALDASVDNVTHERGVATHK